MAASLPNDCERGDETVAPLNPAAPPPGTYVSALEEEYFAVLVPSHGPFQVKVRNLPRDVDDAAVFSALEGAGVGVSWIKIGHPRYDSETRWALVTLSSRNCVIAALRWARDATVGGNAVAVEFVEVEGRQRRGTPRRFREVRADDASGSGFFGALGSSGSDSDE